MQKVPQLVLDAVRRSQGKVLVVGSASSAARPRSAFHAVMQASQSTGIPCVPFTPPVADVGAAPASLMDVALDGLGMARRTGCGSVVVVGGGCTVEIAKAIAALIPSTGSYDALSTGKDRGNRLIETVSEAGPTAEVVAVPTTLHGCAAASSTRTWLVDPVEGEVIGLDEAYHFTELPIQCVIDTRLLKESHPSVCSQGALSTIARISDALLAPANENNNDDGALLDLMRQTHLIARKVLAIEASGAKDMRAEVQMDTVNSTTANEGADDICAQYAAIGCIEGRCVSVDGPGPVHSLARVVSASYNLSFGQACALLLPEVASVQIQRGVANNTTVSEMLGILSSGSTAPGDTNADVPKLLRDMTEGVRDNLKGRLPPFSEENIDELAISAVVDASFKSAAKADGGMKHWNRKVVKSVFEGAFRFLEEDCGT
eukprot:g1992.t1